MNGKTTCEWPRQAHVHEVGMGSEVEAQADATAACNGTAVTTQCSELACSAVMGWRRRSSIGGRDSSVLWHERQQHSSEARPLRVRAIGHSSQPNAVRLSATAAS